MTTRDPLRFERLVGRVLHAGLTTSVVLLSSGLVVSIVWPSSAVGGLVLNAGLIILMATPVARVVVSMAEYARMRDWRFVALTSVVLAILLGSCLVAILGG